MMDIEQLKERHDEVRSRLLREAEPMKEHIELVNDYLQLQDAAFEYIDEIGSLKRELERSQAEVVSLTDELEEQQKETDSLLQQMKDEASSQRMKMMTEIDSLRKQLIKAKDLCSLRLVTVTGNYNDIHHNERVNGEELMVKG